MNGVFVGLLATALSLAALAALAAQDPKRRRAFGLPQPAATRPSGLLWGAALAPALPAVLWGGAGGLILWLGATSVLGWAMVATPPGTSGIWLAHLAGRVRDMVASLARRTASVTAAVASFRSRTTRLALLEARLATVEAQLVAMRRQGDVPESHADASLPNGCPVAPLQ